MAGLCPDWILSTGSNVHAAVDREWFTSYTPYKTYVTSPAIVNHSIEVLGIGTVKIPVLKHRVNKGKRSRATITLDNVLHIPSALCNILGTPILLEGDRELNFRDLVLKERDGRTIALFEGRAERTSEGARLHGAPQLPRLKLHHGPNITFAQSKLTPDGIHIISVWWSQAEEEKYFNYCNAAAAAATSATSTGTATKMPVPPYTVAEKNWLKHNSGHRDEFHFLLAHGLHIHKQDDREEGRLILRALMANDSSDEEDDEEQEDDLTGHQADYVFKHEELVFIEKHWGTSEHFLLTYGLKFYDDEDLAEGRRLVRALMVYDE